LVRTGADQVFAVLADGWSYADWVVGAARIRDVDSSWPRAGTKIHHSVGLWPALIHDVTVVEECEPPHRLRLKVHAWPSGAGRVEITLMSRPEGCSVRMKEEAVSGPAKFIPRLVQDLFLSWRNTEALRRLALRAEGQAARV
jgi:hypothetical protein